MIFWSWARFSRGKRDKNLQKLFTKLTLLMIELSTSVLDATTNVRRAGTWGDGLVSGNEGEREKRG